MDRELPVWRSLMWVPVNVDKFVDRAHTRGADVVQLDLEDSIPPAEKDHARKLVEVAAAKVRRGGADVVVRINRPLAMAVRDIESAVCPDVDAISCPKVDSAEHIKLLEEVVSEAETKRGMAVGHTRFIALVETPAAFTRMDAIAAATPRIAGLVLGGEDIASCCGMMVPDDEVLITLKQRMVIAAYAAGVMPLGFISTIADFKDWDRFRQMVRRSRRFGFEGAGCVHPGQVRIINEEYAPSDEELAYAALVVAKNTEAALANRGSFQIDGKMIDAPVVARAERLLRRHASIKAREARTLAAMSS